jgi:hypothetical protein
MLTIPAIKEMQIETRLRFHLTTVGEDVEEKDPSYTAGRNVN